MRVRDAIRRGVTQRAPFLHGNVSGRVYANGATVPTGRLPGAHAATLAAVSVPVYVLCSYATPIAWRAVSGAGSSWHVPDTRYSATTTRHANVARTVIGV
jgi:hypothetical protein